MVVALLLLFLVAPSLAGAQTSQTAIYTLTWSDPNSGQSQEDGANIERSGTATGAFKQIGTVGPDITKYVDTILNDPGGVQQCYRVIYYNKAGTAAPSNVACTAPTLTITAISQRP